MSGSACVAVDVSVVIPTFRRPREIADTIRTVLGQSGVSVEVIVVDDSPEGSAEQPVAALGDGRVTYVKNATPTGGRPSVVRNLGWPLARGSFVHFLDDDDLVTQGHYAAVKEAFAAHPDVGMIYGRIEPFGDGPADQLEHERVYFADAARKSAASPWQGGRFALVARMLFEKALLVCSASVVRRECVERLKGFDPKIRLMEDADFHVRAMRECGVLFLDRTAIRYRIGSPSLMHAPHPTAAQRQEERDGHRAMQANYRKTRGALEFYSLALFARTALRLV
jgi:glycosyltransferase involved in cell wall biosynthesis